MKKRVAILGSTGSIGFNALSVIDHFPQDFEVVGLSAANNVESLARQVQKYKPQKVAILNSDKVKRLKNMLGSSRTKVLAGLEGLNDMAASDKVDIVIAGMAGAGGLIPILKAIEKGKTVALANKEPMVMAGELVMAEAARSGAKIIPIDSEHNAIFQCLEGKKRDDVSKIVLTCSGGPFYSWPEAKLKHITPEMALRHPKWKMGRKITIDSATLMNKGLEIIEATNLFETELSRVEVFIHPEAVVHGIVEFIDGIYIGLFGSPDMRLPIQHALYYPSRKKHALSPLDLGKVRSLHFYPPDEDKFPCLGLAKEARKINGTMTAVLNGANEAAVEAFLKGDLGFIKIPYIIEKVMGRHKSLLHPGLEDILAADKWAREEAERII